MWPIVKWSVEAPPVPTKLRSDVTRGEEVTRAVRSALAQHRPSADARQSARRSTLSAEGCASLDVERVLPSPVPRRKGFLATTESHEFRLNHSAAVRK
jgi:hypothetical protein